MEDQMVIGVLGGMGTYATIYLFEQYAEIFKAEKEWERPRIVIDNRCTMPSRVRAYLYSENVDQLINEMSDSLEKLSDLGCNKLILACNTSHLFLKDVLLKKPIISKKATIENIITNCVLEIKKQNDKSVYLLASEGTIESKIYQNELEKYNINCNIPKKEDYILIRKCIESVKQNIYTEETKNIFLNLMKKETPYILGCTELPILYFKYQKYLNKKNIYEPIRITLNKLRKEYRN